MVSDVITCDPDRCAVCAWRPSAGTRWPAVRLQVRVGIWKALDELFTMVPTSTADEPVGPVYEVRTIEDRL
jgi:hypothetical protein